MDAQKVVDRQQYLSMSMYAGLSIIFVISLLLVWYFSVALTRDFRALASAMGELSELKRKQAAAAAAGTKHKSAAELDKAMEDVQSNLWTTLGGPPKF